MVAPLAPTPISPDAKAVTDTAQRFTIQYNHPGGLYGKAIRLRRQVASYPTPGTYQWWRNRSKLQIGTTGSVQYPDTASLHINGNLTLTFYVKMADYTPAAQQVLVLTSAANAGFNVGITTGGLIQFNNGNGTSTFSSSSTAAGLTDGQGYWLELFYDATARTTRFRKSSDSPETVIASVSWTTISTSAAHGGTGGIGNTLQPLYLGSTNTPAQRISGSISRFQIKNSSNQIVLDHNFGLTPPGTTVESSTTTDGFTQTVTITSDNAVVADTAETGWFSTSSSTPVTLVSPNDRLSIDTTGWTNGLDYYWSAAMIDTANVAGPYSNQLVLSSHATPVPTIFSPSGAQASPFFRVIWDWTSSANELMRDYRFWIYTSDVYSMGSFDPSMPEWQALAKWSMDTPRISSTEFYYDVAGFVANTTDTYRVYGEFHDTGGLSSGFVSSPATTVSANSMPIPSVTTEVNQANGKVTLIISGGYNLIADANSDFVDGTVGDWVNVLNAQLDLESATYFSPPGSLRLTSAGMTFGQLDTAWGTFANEDTGYTTFAQMQAAQASPAGTIRARSMTQIPVSPSTAYSVLMNVLPYLSGQTGKIMLYWWKADTTASAVTPVTTATGDTLPISSWKDLRLTATSPSDAAFVSVGIEIGPTATVGSSFLIDAVVLRAGTTVEWIAGSGVAYQYVVTRTESDGLVYDMPNASLTEPFNPGGGQNVARIVDVDPPINDGPFFYTVWAVQGTRPLDTWSPPATILVSNFTSDTWFIKTADGLLGSQLHSESRARRINVDDEVQGPTGFSHPIVLFSSAPDVEEWSFSAWSLSIEDYDALLAILRSKRPLVVQTNLHGERIYGTVVGGLSESQRRAVPLASGQPVRPVRSVDFKLVGTGRIA